jgi:hypothetical protein
MADSASPDASPTLLMEHIRKQLAKIDQNIKINSADPVALHGFTQVPNFILKNPDISNGAKTTYALFLSYAWHNSPCFPGQDTLAKGELSRVPHRV